MLLKSVFNKDKNNYYYNNTFLEKGSYELPKNNDDKYLFWYDKYSALSSINRFI